MKKNNYILILLFIFLISLFYNVPSLIAQRDTAYDPVEDLKSLFLTVDFSVDKNITFIPIVINNATNYKLNFSKRDLPLRDFAYFPQSIDSQSTGYAFIYSNIIWPNENPAGDYDYCALYHFNDAYSTPFVLHLLKNEENTLKKMKVYNGIQTGLRIANAYIRILKKVVGPGLRIALTIVNLAIAGTNVALSINKLAQVKDFYYFLAYPYSRTEGEISTPSFTWYKDNKGNQSVNSVSIHGIKHDDSTFVTENYIVWDNDSANYPQYPDTTKFKGYQPPRIVVNIYQNYLYQLSKVMVSAECVKSSTQYNENTKLKKLVDHILENDTEKLSKFYSEIGYDAAEKTSALLYECFTNEPMMPSANLDTKLDEILKLYKLQ